MTPIYIYIYIVPIALYNIYCSKTKIAIFSPLFLSGGSSIILIVFELQAIVLNGKKGGKHLI